MEINYQTTYIEVEIFCSRTSLHVGTKTVDIKML